MVRTSNDPYTFSVGNMDVERMNIQNRLCDPYTKRFRYQYLPDTLYGKTVLDVGCGTGLLSCYWSREVGNIGKVVAVDSSMEQLEIAKFNAKNLDCKNIQFIHINAHDIENIKEEFDMVYCRFLLMHVLNQESLMESLVKKIKHNGYLLCEEVLSYDSFFADPDSLAFQAWKKLILEQPKIHNTDFYIGKRLNSIFRKLNLGNINTEVCQPIICKEDDKGYFYLGFTEFTKQKFVDKGIATLDEINQILDNLKREMFNKDWVASAVQYIQIIGQRTN